MYDFSTGYELEDLREIREAIDSLNEYGIDLDGDLNRELYSEIEKRENG